MGAGTYVRFDGAADALYTESCIVSVQPVYIFQILDYICLLNRLMRFIHEGTAFSLYLLLHRNMLFTLHSDAVF